MEKLKDEYVEENGLYFLGSFINSRVNSGNGVHMHYQDLSIDYEELEKCNFDELSFASLLHTVTKVIPESISLVSNLSSYEDGIYWYEDKEKALKLLFNKLMPLDFNKVWLNIDIDDYCDINELIFKTIIKVVSLDSFINKVEKCDDIELVYELYMIYGKIHNISQEEMNEKFISYLETYIKKEGKTYEEIFLYYFETYKYKSESFAKNLIKLLLPKLNMDYVIEERADNRILLKDEIAKKLSSLVSYDSYDKELVNDFLNLNLGMYFKGDYVNAPDTCQLNFIVGNIEKAKEIFYSDAYELCSLEQYNALSNDGCYDIEKYGRPIERLSYILNIFILPSAIEIDKRKKIILELLYSDKVKMIDKGDLTAINLILGDEEYNKFMKYVLQNDILVYDYNDSNQIYCVNYNKEKYFVEVINCSNSSTTEFKIVDNNAYNIFSAFLWQLNHSLPEERRELEVRPLYRVKLVGENLLPIIDIPLTSYCVYEKIIDYMLKNNILAHYKKEKKFERVRRFLGNKGKKAE